VGALVGGIEHAVVVVVRLGAAVFVLPAVLVFRRVGALVDVVENAVAVAVFGSFERAALVLGRAGQVRAAVVLVEDAVPVSVGGLDLHHQRRVFDHHLLLAAVTRQRDRLLDRGLGVLDVLLA